MKHIFKILLLFLLISPTNNIGKAQSTTYDEQKFLQWRSMENPIDPGDWNFGPDWYYYITHKNYSGASMKWEWHGFKSGFRIHFDEEKSNVKRVMIERAAQIAAVMETKNKTIAELDTITPIYNEEMIRTAERNVDIMYSQYKDEYTQMQSTITSALSYSLGKSNGRLYDAVAQIQQANDLVLKDIEYTHKTGEGYEMENTKRQIAYEENLKKMQEIANLSTKLAHYAKCNYDLNSTSSGDLIQVTPK